MTYLPELAAINSPAKKQIISFEGYNVQPVIEDGEMRDMLNLSSEKYPNLSQRQARGFFTVGGIAPIYPDPEHILVKNGALAVICKDAIQTFNGPARFFYGYEKNGDNWSPVPYPDVKVQELSEGQRHMMVSIGKRICIWPEKIWFNVETKESGTLYGNYEMLQAGSIVIKNDTTTSCTMTLPEGADLSGFTTNDAIELYFTDTNQTVYTTSSTIKEIRDNVMVLPADTFLSILPDFPGTEEEYTFSGTVLIERYVPDLDFVMESGNRLWGCHDNAICCCKLGDPTNWHYYQGLSVDAYEVEVGTDGPWTGCVPYSTHLLFFKENYIHKVFGNTPATYQTQQSECYGLEKGSEKSVCVINGTVFYKSKIGIMAYGGTLPEHISANLGSKYYCNAIAGSDGAKYYVNMETRDGSREQLVFDLDRVLWHKEDDMQPIEYVYLTNDTYNEEGKNQLLYLRRAQSDDDINRICSVSPYVPFADEEKGLRWMAELGPFDEFIEDKKIYSKLKMRLKLDDDAEITVLVKFNDGEWQKIRHIYQSDERSAYIPISPIRCDKFFVRLEGVRECTVESLVREYRERSDR